MVGQHRPSSSIFTMAIKYAKAVIPAQAGIYSTIGGICQEIAVSARMTSVCLLSGRSHRWILLVGLLSILTMTTGCGPYIQDAVRSDDAGLLQQMIDDGANPMKTGFKGETLLHVAANRNAVEAARILMQAGLAVDARDKDGRTPLHLAVFRGFAAMTAFLVDHGADVTIADHQGQTPLHLARIGGYPDLIAVMVPEEDGVDDGRGNTVEDDWFAIGNRLALAQQHAAAVRAYRLELELNGEDEKSYFNLGLSYLGMGQVDAALEAFQSAVRLDPDYARAYYNIGVIQGGQGNYTDALEAFRAVLRIDPADADAWYNLGNSYDGLHRYDKALAAWESAIDAAPRMPAPRFNMVIVLHRLGRHDQAREQYDALKRTHPEMAADLASLIEPP
jgi:hypothetical protein